jgi:hypothetical protein
MMAIVSWVTNWGTVANVCSRLDGEGEESGQGAQCREGGSGSQDEQAGKDELKQIDQL